MFAGSYYDTHFNLYQSGISLALIFVALSISRQWYIKSFCCVAILHLALNAADALVYVPAANYNQIALTLNVMEFILLFIIGGISQWRQYNDGHGYNHTASDGLGDRR